MILVFAQRAWARPFWLCVLLVTIAFHAFVPYGSPLVRTQGSAFSATTSDVGVTPKRKDRTATIAVQDADDNTGSDTGTPPGDLARSPDAPPLQLPRLAAVGSKPAWHQHAAHRRTVTGPLGARAPPNL